MPATKKAVDFTNVKEMTFAPKHKPAGEYRAKITKVEDHVKDSDTQWLFTIVPVSDQRAIYPYYCQLTEKAAWKIRKLCVAAGMAVPKKRVMVDPNKLVGKEIGISLDDDEYEGKLKSVIVDTFPAEDLTDDEPEQEEAPARKPAKKTASKKPVQEDVDEDVDEDDLDELDLEEV